MNAIIKIQKLAVCLTLALVAAIPLTGFAQPDLEKDPAYLPIDKYLDMTVVHPEVNVNLPRFLLKDVTAGLGASNVLTQNGIDLADLVKDVKLIRVVVVEVSNTNRTEVDKAVKKLKGELASKWTPIVVVPEENVNIYAMGDASGDSMAGLGILVYDGGDLVVGNIVGHVSIGKILQIAAQKNKLPKDFLRKLINADGGGGNQGTQPATKVDDGNGGSTTNTPAADANAAPNK